MGDQYTLNYFNREIHRDYLIYLTFVIFYIIAYHDLLFQKTPFWVLNMGPLPVSKLGYYIIGDFYWFPGSLGCEAQPNIATWLRLIVVLISCGDLVIADKLLMSSTLVSCFTMYIFLSNHFTKSRLARFAASLIFGFGPSTVLNYADIMHWGYAIMPIAFNYMLNIVKGKKEIKYIISLSLSLSFMTDLLPQIILLIFLSFLIFFTVQLLAATNKVNYFIDVIIPILIASLIYIFTSPYLISGGLRLLETLGFTFYNERTITSLPELLYTGTYMNQVILNTIRLIGGSPSNHLPETNWIGFVLPIFAFSSLIFVRERTKMLNLLALTLISIIIITIIYGIHLEVFWAIWLVRNTPIKLFLYPERPLYVVTFVYTTMISVTIDELISKVNHLYKRCNVKLSHKILKWTISTLLVCSLLISTFLFAPVFDTQIHKKRYCPLPIIYSSIQNWLSNLNEQEVYRIMFLPTDSFSVELGLYDVFEYTPGFALRLTGDYIDFVYNQIITGTNHYIGSLLAYASVKYVILATPDKNTLWKTEPDQIVPLDPNWDLSGPTRYTTGAIQGNPLDIAKILESQKDLRLIYMNKDFRVYENIMYLPKVSLFSKATCIVGAEAALAVLPYLPGFNANKNILIFLNQNNESAKKLLEVSSLIVFFNVDINDYTNLISSHTYEDIMNITSSKKQLYLFTLNSPNFTRSVTTTSGQWLIALKAQDTSINSSLDTIEYDQGQYNCGYPVIYIDGVSIPRISDIDKWIIFRPICLNSGTHRLDISNGFRESYVAIYNTEHLVDVFYDNTNISYNYFKLGETSYEVDVENNSSVFLSLSESYHPNWLASFGDKQLLHFITFSFSNGYYLRRTSESIGNINIKYDPPLISQMYVLQQILFVTFLVVLIVLPILHKIRNKNLQQKLA